MIVYHLPSILYYKLNNIMCNPLIDLESMGLCELENPQISNER